MLLRGGDEANGSDCWSGKVRRLRQLQRCLPHGCHRNRRRKSQDRRIYLCRMWGLCGRLPDRGYFVALTALRICENGGSSWQHRQSLGHGKSRGERWHGGFILQPNWDRKWHGAGWICRRLIPKGLDNCEDFGKLRYTAKTPVSDINRFPTRNNLYHSAVNSIISEVAEPVFLLIHLAAGYRVLRSPILLAPVFDTRTGSARSKDFQWPSWPAAAGQTRLPGRPPWQVTLFRIAADLPTPPHNQRLGEIPLFVAKNVSKSGNRRASQIALAKALRNCSTPPNAYRQEKSLANRRHFSGGFHGEEAHPATSNIRWLRAGASATRRAGAGFQLPCHL